jgi:hypothetical protein
MKVVRMSVCLSLLLVLMNACHLEQIRHDPEMAVLAANTFLSVLYFNEDYDKAIQLADAQLRDNASINDLRNMVGMTKRERGRLQSLTADSYVINPGHNIGLFYIGHYAGGGILYHRLVLIGDATSGYRVAGVWFSRKPYPSTSSRHKFEGEFSISESAKFQSRDGVTCTQNPPTS